MVGCDARRIEGAFQGIKFPGVVVVTGVVVEPVWLVTVVGVIVTPNPEVVLVLVPVLTVEAFGVVGFVKTTAPDPTVLPPVVLVAVVPGVVGTVKVGTVPTVLERVVELGSVDGMVPALITPARLGLRLDVLVRVTVRRVEPTVPTVATPTTPPWTALFAAPRLLGASAWIVKGVPDAAVPELDVPPDADCVDVPRTILNAPALDPAGVKTERACSAARCSCRSCRCSCTTM
jgi:hypothetical protein